MKENPAQNPKEKIQKVLGLITEETTPGVLRKRGFKHIAKHTGKHMFRSLFLK